MPRHARPRKRNKDNRKAGRLPKNAAPLTVTISHIGSRGDGVGRASYTHHYRTEEHLVFVPATLPGEQVLAQPLSLSAQGIRARVIELQREAPDRQAPGCEAFPACGGCAFQHWGIAQTTDWKMAQVTHFLDHADVAVSAIMPTHVSPPRSRRRARFHIKRLVAGSVVGFHERQGSQIVAPSGCAILEPPLLALTEALKALGDAHLPVGMMLTAQANLLDQGVCLLIEADSVTDTPPLERSPALLAAFAEWARGVGLARLSLLPDGSGRPDGLDPTGGAIPLYAPSPPTVNFGAISVAPPAGAFLQASRDGEARLQAAVDEITKDAKTVLDLFAGCGTLSLPLLGRLSRLHAVEAAAAPLESLKAGADASGLGARVTTRATDLAAAPLTIAECAGFDAAIIDPPRSGAAAQCAMLARSTIPRLAMVSCNPASFARDAAILCDGGYRCDWLQIVDQFRMSPHIELVAQFSRQAGA